MMSYNDGHIQLDFYDEESNYEQIASDFSEGDQQLCECLKELWKNNIRTFTCCKGHGDDEQPLIGIIIDDNSKNLIQDLCDNMDASILIRFGLIEGDTKAFTFHMSFEESKQKFLDFIMKHVSSKESDKEDKSRLPVYGDYLLSFATETGLDCEYICTLDEMGFEFFRNGRRVFFDGNCISMDDFIKIYQEEKNILLGPVACDPKSLERFLSIFYVLPFESDIDKTK